MLSRLRTDLLYLSFLLIPTLLHTASGYVAQSPDVLVAPGISSHVATTSSSSMIELSSVQQDFGQERVPFGFKVEYIWKAHGIAFDRLKLFNTIFLEMAILAGLPWNGVVNIIQTPPLFGVVISFIGDRIAKNMRTKHAIWALKGVFGIFVDARRYAPGSVVVAITNTVLGVGSVQPARPIQATSFQAEGPSNATAPLTVSRNSQGSAGLSNPEEIKVEINYRPGGVAFDSTQIFNASLELLIRIAEPADRDASIGPILSTYNDIENFTISLVSNPFAKSTVLSWADCVVTIYALIVEMRVRGPGGTWAELDGTIGDGRLEVGRLCIDRGDLTRLDPATVCTNVLGASVLRV